MAPNLQENILDRAKDGSYISEIVGFSEEDQELMNMFRPPEKKPEPPKNTERIIEKANVNTDKLSSDVDNLSESTNSLSKSVNKSTGILSRAINKIGGIFNKDISENEKHHKTLVDLITQLKVTETIINSNSENLEGLANSNEEVAYLMDVLKKHGFTNEKLSEKILDRQALDTEEASNLLEMLDRAVRAMGNVNTVLDINLSQIIDMYKEMIKDDRRDLDQKRLLLNEVKLLARDSGVSSEAIDKLNQLNVESMKIEGKTAIDTVRLLSKISEDVQGKKVQGTIEELGKKYDKTILEQKELTETLTKKVGKGGETFEEIFRKHPELFSTGETVKHGAIATVLHGIGLGPLEAIGAVEGLGKILTKKGREEYKESAKELFGKVAKPYKKAKEYLFKDKGIKGVEEAVSEPEEKTEEKVEQQEKLAEAEAQKVETAEKANIVSDSLLGTVATAQDAMDNHSESMNSVNDILGKKDKEDTLIYKLNEFDDTLAETAENIEDVSISRDEGGRRKGLFSSLLEKFGGKKMAGLGLGAKMTGGLGLKGLLGAKMGAIGAAGGGAIATSAALVGLAGAAGYGVGKGLDWLIGKATGRGSGAIGDWLAEKTTEGKVEEAEQRQAQKWFTNIQKRMSLDAYALLGDDPVVASTKLKSLRNSGQIVKSKGKWVTAAEAVEQGADISDEAKTVEADVKTAEEAPITEEEVVKTPESQAVAESPEEAPTIQDTLMKERADSVTTAQNIRVNVTPYVEKATQERLMDERSDKVKAKIEPTRVEDAKEIPAEVLQPSAAQKRLMEERSKQTVPPVATTRTPAPVGNGRTTSIDDYSIALMNSMVFQ